jgi:outer membrane lipoprotein LolB
VAVLLGLSACVTTSRVPQAPLTAEQQRAALQGQGSFTLNGRVAMSAGTQGFPPAGISWRQNKESSQVRLSGPLGTAAMLLHYDAGQLRIETGRGEVLEGAAATAALTQQLGFAPPLDALRYWILGLPALGEEIFAQALDNDGRLLQLTQRAWQVSYEDYRAQTTRHGMVQMPRRITATRDGLRLKLVIDRWRME